jgi:hypothetical protein
MKRKPPAWITHAIRQLEIPDCSCDLEIDCGCSEPCDCKVTLGPPCEHVLSADHDLPVPAWIDLLLTYSPQEYAELPPPAQAEPIGGLKSLDRVQVYRERRARGEHLYHPDDMRESEHTARQIKTARNGRVIQLHHVYGHNTEQPPTREAA